MHTCAWSICTEGRVRRPEEERARFRELLWSDSSRHSGAFLNPSRSRCPLAVSSHGGGCSTSPSSRLVEAESWRPFWMPPPLTRRSAEPGFLRAGGFRLTAPLSGFAASLSPYLLPRPLAPRELFSLTRVVSCAA